MKISAVVITGNEENVIGECLKSLAWCDEIIVVDDFSTDGTLKRISNFELRIKNKNKLKIFQRKLNGDFAGQRNFAGTKASGDWLLYVDADEAATADLSQEIISAIKNDGFSAYEIPRLNYYLGLLWPKKEKIIRLMKKTHLRGWRGKVHETAEVWGTIGLIKNALIHHTHRNLSDMVDKTNKWSETEADLRLMADHPVVGPWRLMRVMVSAFVDSYLRDEGWKAGTTGMIESIYQAFSMFITYAKLWERQNKPKK